MKYNELERLIKKAGCFDTGEQQNGHPVWESPKTGKRFRMSNHGKQEVATGTLKAILKAAGLKYVLPLKTRLYEKSICYY